MKTRQAAILIVLLFLVAPIGAAESQNASFAGTWKGDVNGAPAVELRVEEAKGKIGGEIIFYFQERPDPSGPWKVKGEAREPLLSPEVKGKVLTFEVRHHVCHTCEEYGPNVKFRVELTGPDEAHIWNLSEGNPDDDSDSGLPLRRDKK